MNAPGGADGQSGWPGRAVTTMLGVLGIFSLLSFGPRGNEVAGIMSAAFAFITLVFTFYPAPAPHAPGGPLMRTRGRMAAWWRNASPLRRLLNVVGFLILGALVGWGVFQLSLGPAVEYAYRANIVEPRVANGASSSVAFAEPLPDRDNVGVTLDVVEVANTGDCIKTTTLALVPIANGAPGAEVVALPGEEARIDLGRPAQTLTVSVTPRTDDGCVLNLRLRGAIFYD